MGRHTLKPGSILSSYTRGSAALLAMTTKVASLIDLPASDTAISGPKRSGGRKEIENLSLAALGSCTSCTALTRCLG